MTPKFLIQLLLRRATMMKNNKKLSRAVERKVEKKSKIKSWKIIVPVAVAAVLVISLIGIYLFLSPKAGPKTWTVDDDAPADFSSIQGAINSANAGDTISVKAGTYNESYIEVTKAIVLSGENKSTTIIDGAVVAIKANNVNISGFTMAGIYIHASKVVVRDNFIGNGIELYDSNDNNVSRSIITSNSRGIELKYSSNNTINNNTILNNEDGIYLTLESKNNTFSDNIVMNNSGYGVFYDSYWCDGNALIDNTIVNNSGGVRLEYTQNNKMFNNVVSNNTEFGILLFYSNGSLVGNELSNNGEYSIAISGASGNNISNNTILNSEEGIELYESSNNTVKENTLSGNQYAFYIFVSSTTNNSVYGNTISNNNEGIHVAYSSGNTFYHNNFINNSIPVYSRESTNAWDNGYPSGGNHWSGHVCTGNPSNGSQPYVINADNIDNHPFQDPSGWTSLP